MNNSSLLSIQHLTKSYVGIETLHDINLELPANKIIGLLGPNGAGKTTLIKILANLLSQYDGKILIDGHKLGIESKKIISYLPDTSYLNEKWEARKILDFFEDFFEDFQYSKSLMLLEQFHIPLDKSFKSLSKGTKEKLQLITTLCRNAKLYLFDEPIAGVDPLARQEIFDLILQNRNPQSSVIISTHLVSDVEKYVDMCIFIKEGSIIKFGDTSEVRKNYSNLEEAFKGSFR
ncbi:ABC transporter ATP-binding protein [Helicobacter cappadocius]|uniref:ABC transporter ATP-binding protein n=1 Tax=Helicobacter cappadocius TaxID=3063998 RepID=A0AA90PXV7_9HELI|nr:MULTISPECIES: ABC transporter ATP-binding protein [unclassified Helicobacter]MDO7252636.1 ABC transporter ATP-binding protein [Helicobacter sp. faydin-H75]MDP2538503.1 ABC transporter ATP-binding protein [Helicobacter sp. faydin-H76]